MTTVLRFSVPGVAPDRLAVEQTGRILSVRAERPAAPGVRTLLRQIPTGRFEVHYTLPLYVEVERASLENGVLSVHLARRVPEALRPRAIPVATAGRHRLAGSPRRAAGWLERAAAWVRRQLPTGVPARA